MIGNTDEVNVDNSTKRVRSEVPAPKPRLIIKEIVLQDFKSYGGRKVVGPFHECFSAIVGPHEKIEKNVEVVDMDKLLKFGPEHFKRASVCDLFLPATQIMDLGMVRNPSKPGKRLEECYKGAVVKFDDGTLRAIPVEQFMLPGVPCMAKDGAHEGAEEMFAFRLTAPFELRQCNDKLCRIVVIIKWESDNKLCCKDDCITGGSFYTTPG